MATRCCAPARSTPARYATVELVRLATSKSASGSLMLLLSCPSVKSTIRWRRPSSGRRRELDGDAVEDGAAAAPRQRRERGVGCRRRRLEVREPADLHVERDEFQTVARTEIGLELAHGPAQLIEHRPGDAGADVEHHRHVDRQALVVQIRDLLGHAVVEQLEVADLQPGHRPLVAPNGSFDGDDVRAGAERGRGFLLRNGAGRIAAKQCRGESDDATAAGPTR